MNKSLKKILNDSSVIFWDFDGVIKDSVAIKASAFQMLFSKYGKRVADLIETHHIENGGLSRFEKIPLYLSWSGERVTKENIEKYCHKFSLLVKRSTIDSPWVPGVQKYLELNYNKKKFILVTATPRDEIEDVLKELSIQNYFMAVYGSPILKINAIRDSINRFKIEEENVIMIGDSLIDYEAAVKNNILFALRRTEHNLSLQKRLICFKFKDFNDE